MDQINFRHRWWSLQRFKIFLLLIAIISLVNGSELHTNRSDHNLNAINDHDLRENSEVNDSINEPTITKQSIRKQFNGSQTLQMPHSLAYKNYIQKRNVRSTIDKSIFSPNNSKSILPLAEENKSFFNEGFSRTYTINDNSSSQTVNGSTNSTIKSVHGKYNKKVNRTKKSSSSSEYIAPKNSFLSSVSEQMNELNIVNDNSLINVTDLVNDSNISDSDTEGYSEFKHNRHKKDQLLIREDQGVVILRKYTCIPCKVVPGQQQRQQQLDRRRPTHRPKYRECRCNPYGSLNRSCNRQNGQCYCKTNVTGQRCDRCIPGHWNLESGNGCKICQCNLIGSEENNCDIYTSQCNCKLGVGGQSCDRCLEGYYGFSAQGCKKCDDCPNSAYICDGETGRCICPNLSKGPDCQQCYQNSWGWEHQKGCKLCDCDHIGAIGQTCDLYTGHCICREGYTGRRCDFCAPGYYGYPNCQRCNCNIGGSIANSNGLVLCDESGQCPCKSLVNGLKCDQCRSSTFGLTEHNPTGCTRCYCFGRSQNCQQSDFTWGQIRSYGSRNLSIEYFPLDYEYVIVVQMEDSRTYREDAEIEMMFGLHLIPSSTGNVSIGARNPFHMPLYFQLPPQFFGDQIKSYGGYLRYSITTVICDRVLDHDTLSKFPLVQLHSHDNLILDYYGPQIYDTSSNATYTIGIYETYWRYHFNGLNITRAIMMTALQNVKRILVRGTTWADFTQVVLSNVQMDTGIYISGSTNHLALGVETCSCPEQYNGTSCQDPADGYYRWKNSESDDEQQFEEYVGKAVPCQCNGRSESCNIETGYCKNCRHFTAGQYCDTCAEGYYGHPDYEGCQPCPCPETNRNFARGCTVYNNKVSCICKPGYTGQFCDKCQLGYYGSTEGLTGQCIDCDCNPDGIVSNECDEITGQCNCKVGLTGQKCDQCEQSRHIFQDGQCRICDNCTLTLLERTDELKMILELGINHIDLDAIPAPWPRVVDYDNKTKKLEFFLNDFLVAKNSLENYNEDIIEKLHSRASNINRRLHKLLIKTDKRNHGSENLKSETGINFSDIQQLKDKIQTTIETLNRYGLHDHHINLPMALNEAQLLLESITSKAPNERQNRDILKCARKALNIWSNTSEILSHQMIEVDDLKSTAQNIISRLNDADHNVHRTQTLLDNAIDEHEINLQNFKILADREQQIQSMKMEIFSLNNNGIVPATDELFEEIEDNHGKILRDLADVIELKDIVNDTNTECSNELEMIKRNWLPEAKDHSEDLMYRAREYSRSFQNTKNGAEVALMASTAHKNITDAIEEARQSSVYALEAVSKSHEVLHPPMGKSLIEIGLTSVEKSANIEKDAIDEIEKLEDLEDILKGHQKHVDTIKNTIWQAGLKNNNISSSLNGFNSSATMKEISDTLETSMKISDQMREVRSKAVDISSDVYKLKIKLASLEPNWDTKLGMAQENVSQSLSNIRAANTTLNNMESMSVKNKLKFQQWNDSMSIKLQELRDKIAKAKHTADGIRVSLESKLPKCIRSYFPQIYGLTTSNKLKISMALSTNNENSPLLFVQGDGSKFLALEMVKRKIRLLWNLGGETRIITHPVAIQTRDLKYDDAWYQIEANRTMNLGSLTVRKMHNNGTLTSAAVHSDASSPDFTRFSVSSNNRMWIGGVPADIKPKELVDNIGLGVVLHQVYVDGSQIGLWDFAHSEGECTGAMLGAQETSTISNSRHFNGDGYAALTKARSKPYKKNLFFLQITFKTLDENALLFLAVDEKNNRSISLTLHEGRIVFRIDYGGDSKLEINTTKKFNTGIWVNVEAARQFTPKRNTENGSLKVNNEEPKTGSPTTPITSHMLPDFTNAIYYLGGVPPGFKSGTTKAPGADHAYLGCMRDIQIYGESYDPLDRSIYYGVEPTCRDTIAIAGFNGNGYAELPSHSLRKRGNFGFVFRTLQTESLLVLSAYPPSISDEYDQKDLRGNYSVSLIDGRIHVWIDAGKGRIELISNKTVNDGEYHVLSVQKLGRRIELRIDDEFQVARSFSIAPFVVNMPEDLGGLYFGGVPDFPEYDHLAPTFEGFRGAIKDIVFNNQTISFDTVLNFSNVHMGRSGPTMGYQAINNNHLKTEPIGKSFTAQPEGCHRVGIYSYEPNAFKFGDGPHSHSIVNIPARHLWQKNFNIQFDFRTFYPDGVLFLAPGTKEKQKHFIGLILREGQLSLAVRGRKKEELNLSKKLNDGQWHHILLNSIDKKLTIRIDWGMNGDDITMATIKLPKRLNAANMIYIGGIPENSVTLPIELLSKLEEFKGCIRRFTVNNATQDLARPGKHYNVGQCFPRVEKGSYFPGDAFAIYKRNFHVGKYLELEFEFRTSELSGALLSVSEPVGFPALSIEMNNGKIVMSCDLGDGNPFRVETNNLPSKFALCDNKWHNVSAMYDSEQIALRIDNQASIIALAQHRMSGKVNTKSPLYIGGLPDIAPSGTLLNRENFKGCIRNVVIRNELKDWTDMDELHNVLLSECLAIN